MDDPPATRQPAPGALALVQDFVNSAELPHSHDDPNFPHGGWDELGDIELATTWLRDHGFEFRPDEAQRKRIVETRENLRTVLAVNSDQPLPQAAATRLSRLLDAAAVHPVVGEEGVRLTWTSRGVDGFLAAIVAALVESTVDGSFARLKVCRSETCQWAFYDSSKNGCGAWCSMRSCGSRAKAKAYRERRRAGEPAPSG